MMPKPDFEPRGQADSHLPTTTLADLIEGHPRPEDQKRRLGR